MSAEKISRPGPGRRATRFSRGQDYLRKVDPVIGRLVERRPDFDPLAWLDELPPMDLFGSLLFQVAGQQLSVAATRRIVGRVTSLFGDQMPSPDQLLAVDANDLRAAGLSWRKVNTLRDLAERFVDGRLDVKRLRGMSDDQFIAELTAVPGIGPWTAAGCFARRASTGGHRAARRPRAPQSDPRCVSPRSSAESRGGPRNRREVAPVPEPGHVVPLCNGLCVRPTRSVRYRGRPIRSLDPHAH